MIFHFVFSARYDEERRLVLGREEMLHYLREKKRRALPSTSKRVSALCYKNSPHSMLVTTITISLTFMIINFIKSVKPFRHRTFYCSSALQLTYTVHVCMAAPFQLLCFKTSRTRNLHYTSA